MRLMFTWVLGRLQAASAVTLVPNSNLSESADRVGGQLRGDKEWPLQWRNQFWQSLNEGAGTRRSESHSEHRLPAPSSKLCQI